MSTHKQPTSKKADGRPASPSVSPSKRPTQKNEDRARDAKDSASFLRIVIVATLVLLVLMYFIFRN